MESNKDKIIQIPYSIFNFSKENNIPENKWDIGNGYIKWGKNDDWGQFLLDLYNYKGYSPHKAIINKKVKYIIGNGFKKAKDERLNILLDKYKNEYKKCVLDYKIYNGLALEIIYTNDNKDIASIKALPFHKFRININDETGEIDYDNILFSNNWKEKRKAKNKPELLPLFKKDKNGGGKQIFYYCEYNPDCDDLYPIAEYSSGINWIDLGYRISTFHLKQVEQGYAPSFLLNFATGIPSPEKMQEDKTRFENEYKGEMNAGKMIITFSQGSDDAPKFEKIDLNDSDERFTLLREQIAEETVQAHEAPAPMFILTPGKLASTAERLALTEEFQYSYVDQNQETIENILSDIFSTVGITEKPKLKTYKNAKDTVVDKLSSLDPEILKAVIAQMSTEEIRALVGLPAQIQQEIKPEITE